MIFVSCHCDADFCSSFHRFPSKRKILKCFVQIVGAIDLPKTDIWRLRVEAVVYSGYFFVKPLFFDWRHIFTLVGVAINFLYMLKWIRIWRRRCLICLLNNHGQIYHTYMRTCILSCFNFWKLYREELWPPIHRTLSLIERGPMVNFFRQLVFEIFKGVNYMLGHLFTYFVGLFFPRIVKSWIENLLCSVEGASGCSESALFLYKVIKCLTYIFCDFNVFLCFNTFHIAWRAFIFVVELHHRIPIIYQILNCISQIIYICSYAFSWFLNKARYVILDKVFALELFIGHWRIFPLAINSGFGISKLNQRYQLRVNLVHFYFRMRLLHQFDSFKSIFDFLFWKPIPHSLHKRLMPLLTHFLHF